MVQKTVYQNPRWQTAAIFFKYLNCHNSRSGIMFGSAMGFLGMTDREIFFPGANCYRQEFTDCDWSAVTGVELVNIN